jgi:hypothetical protein
MSFLHIVFAGPDGNGGGFADKPWVHAPDGKVEQVRG